jgi:DNA primase
VLEFVSQYVDLKLTAGGAIGLCPFHDDHHPSFGVNDCENYRHCSAGCGGGSVINSYTEWRECYSAIRELAEMLL